jgi:hypothetical protein
MGLFGGRRSVDASYPRGDRGSGSLDDYNYGLVARNKSVTIVLAGSDPYQDELRQLVESGEQPQTGIAPRSIEQERSDAPIEVRLFTGRRVSGPVGMVPRGLESVVDETLRRLDDEFGAARIPARIIRKSGAWRVQLLMGELR